MQFCQHTQQIYGTRTITPNMHMHCHLSAVCLPECKRLWVWVPQNLPSLFPTPSLCSNHTFSILTCLHSALPGVGLGASHVTIKLSLWEHNHCKKSEMSCHLIQCREPAGDLYYTCPYSDPSFRSNWVKFNTYIITRKSMACRRCPQFIFTWSLAYWALWSKEGASDSWFRSTKILCAALSQLNCLINWISIGWLFVGCLPRIPKTTRRHKLVQNLIQQIIAQGGQSTCNQPYGHYEAVFSLTWEQCSVFVQ